MGKMKKEYIDIYYDHYKDTFDKIIIEKSRRNKHFVFMLLVAFSIFLTMFIPEVVYAISISLIKEKVGLSKSIDYSWIKTILIFSFIWISFLYYQTTLNIERLYSYIHKVEKQLSDKLGSLSINREGTNYLNGYPILLSIIHRIYNVIIPITISAVFCFRWYLDNLLPINAWGICNYVDTFSEFIIVMTSILFLIRMNKDIFKNKSAPCPPGVRRGV
jgi:hypothetical protein